jgi:hypothetical protein
MFSGSCSLLRLTTEEGFFFGDDNMKNNFKWHKEQINKKSTSDCSGAVALRNEVEQWSGSGTAKSAVPAGGEAPGIKINIFLF